MKIGSVWKDSVNSRVKIYLIFIYISLILLFISIWQISPALVNDGDFLGLTSHLTPVYWVGFSIAIICSIIAYLNREPRRELLYVLVLIVIILYTVGLPSFLSPNPPYSHTYRTITGTEEIISTGHIDLHSELPAISYPQWPLFNIFAANIIQIAGIHTFTFLTYFPIFIAIFLILVIFNIGKRLGLEPRQCFVFGFIFLTSQWHSYMLYPAPQPLATALYLLFFMIALTLENTVQMSIICILIFIALVFTHGMTPVVLIAALAIQSIYTRKFTLPILLAVIFGAWYLYVQPELLNIGVIAYYETLTPANLFNQIFNSTKYAAITTQREIINNIRLSYFPLYAIYGMTALIIYLKARVRHQMNKGKLVGILICWMLGPPLVSFGFGVELTERLYFLLLAPALAFIISFLSEKLLIPLIIISALLVIPAHYGTASFEFTPDTEIIGAGFYARNIDASQAYYYGIGNVGYLTYYNEDFFNMSSMVETGNIWSESDPQQLNKAQYIIDSRITTNFNLYYYGTDFVRDYIATHSSDVIYVNGDFSVYQMR